MKISSVKAVVTASDILSILEEFVKVDGLSFDNIYIDDFIRINGNYKAGINIPFSALIGVGSVKDEKIILKLIDIKVLKLGIASKVRNFAIKKSLEEFSKYGIFADKDNIIVDMKEIGKIIPYVNFKLTSITLKDYAIEVEINNLSYDSTDDKGDKEQSKKLEIKKAEDLYTKKRYEVLQKVPDKYEELIKYIMIVPDLTALLVRLFKDKRVDMKTKFIVGTITAYLASPIDILPDFIPFIGKIDDVVIVFYGLNCILNEVSEEVILENWEGEDNIIKIIQEGINYVSNIIGVQNLSKIINYFKMQNKNVNKNVNKDKNLKV